MRSNLFLFFLLTITIHGYGQYTFIEPSQVPDLWCHINVNERGDQNFRNDLKRAAFRLTIPGFGVCSGTLINRNTGQNELGQYFITAWHCFKSGTNCGGNDFDFSNPVTMTFNYQSPGVESVVFAENVSGVQYQITRQLRLVDKFSCAYGDFALCEILGAPIPPHFNTYFAGWYPNELFINRNGQFASIHHPGASIKKVTAVNNISGTTPIKATCRTVTKVIDFLFGWIWRRRWSTQIICTYIQTPFLQTKYRAMDYVFGKLEDGSSGCGIFTGNSGFAGANRLIGDYSASSPNHHCAFIDIGVSYFGKFADSYYRQDVKNTLNPPNKYWIDQSGIPGRQITCYPELNINAEGTGFDLFPASLYQQENNITLTSQSNTNTNGVIRIRTGADFNFIANQSITLNPGFEVEPGAIFNAALIANPCQINNNSYRLSETEQYSEYESPDLNSLLKKMPLPQEKLFDINKYISTEEKTSITNFNKFTVYPNPSNGTVQLEAFFKGQEKIITLQIFDIGGNLVYSKNYNNIYFIKEQYRTSLTVTGIYNVVLRSSTETMSRKLFVVK